MMKLNIQMFASTNKTANYELPQFVGTDKPTWLGDFNTAMATIDGGMAENKSNIKSMDSRVSSAEATASQASQNVSALTTRVDSVESSVSSATTTANNAQSTATTALNTANTANGKSDTNASAITTIESNVSALQTKTAGLKGTILWTNSSPTSSFSQQNITLSSSNYDMYEVIYCITASSTATSVKSTGKLTKGTSTELDFTYNNGIGLVMRRRDFTYIDDTHYTVSRNTGADGDYACRPLYVIGYKTGLF